MNKNVLVVGGAGYIGSHVAKELFKKGYYPIIYDNLINGHREFAKWGAFIKADLSNKTTLDIVFQKYSIIAVMHFAAFTYVGESVEDPRKYYINNVAHTIDLLDLMLKNKSKYLIFSSSCAVYGSPQKIPIPEDHPLRPINPYGRSKYMVEQILFDYWKAYGLKYISLRYFNAAGADPDGEVGEDHNPETHLIPLVLDAALGKRDSVTIFGSDYATPDGTCIRDYIHVADLANAHILALEKLINGYESDVINLGNGVGFSVKEIIETTSKVTGKEITAIPGMRRQGDPPILLGSSEKARKKLGWIPKYPQIEIIIGHSWNWHKKRFCLDR